MEDLKKLAAITALNKMLSDGYFSICTIDTIAKMLAVTPPSQPYSILHTLHCVKYADMPPEIKAALPDLIRQCLDLAPDFRFGQPPPPRAGEIVDVAPEPRRSGFMRLLRRP